MVAKEPLVTIGVGIFEGNEYVASSITSVLLQDYDNLEIIVVDDRGKTNAMQIVTDTIDAFPEKRNIRYIRHPENLKTGGVRNTVIDNANGEYVFFMDSDDTITTDCISTLVAASDNGEADIVKASFRCVRNNKENKYYSGVSKSFTFNGTPMIDAFYDNGEEFWGNMTNAIFRLQFLKDNNIRCVQMKFEDDYFFLLAAMKAMRGAFLSNVTYIRLLHDRSIMGSMWKNGVSPYDAEQAVDGISCKYKAIDGWNNAATRTKLLLNTIKQAMQYMYRSRNSSQVSRELYRKLSRILLSYPMLPLSTSIALTKHQRHKLLFYGILRRLPLAFRRFVIYQTTFRHYRKIELK